jgi:hypothetical protein
MMSFLDLGRHRRWSAMATAYGDGSLEESERPRFERHLGGCSRCATQISDERALRTALRSLPDLAAPRSFRLTPAMLVAAEPASRPSRALAWANTGAKLTAGIAAAALAVVMVVDFGPTLSGSDDDDSEAASGAAESTIAMSAIESPSADADSARPAAEATTEPSPLPFDAEDADGSSAGGSGNESDSSPAEGPAAPGDEGTEDDADTQRQAETGEDGTGAAAAELQFAADESDDSTGQVLRGLQIAFGAVLVAAAGAALLLRTRRREAGV